MTSEQQAVNPNPTALRYHGDSKYVDIASRNAGEFLGMSIKYAPHPNGKGYFVVRFVGRGVEESNLKHFTSRGKARFCRHTPNGREDVFGVRLNKVAVQAFDPAIFPHEVSTYAEQFGIWDLLVAWITAQVEAEGFMVTLDLKQELISNFVTPVTVDVKNALELPALDAPPPPVVKSKSQPDEDEDEDDQDKDDDDGDDEDEEPKGWLN